LVFSCIFSTVINAAAGLIINTRRCEHITPVLQQLHWLPVRQRVQFKMSCLYTLLPAYLAEDCHLVCHWTDIRRACGSKPSHVLAITHSLLLDLADETVCQPSYTGTVSRSTQNASVWSLTAAALSDSFFVRCEQICLLTYLLLLHNTDIITTVCTEFTGLGIGLTKSTIPTSNY